MNYPNTKNPFYIGHYQSHEPWYQKELQDIIINFIDKTRNGTIQFNDTLSQSIKNMRTSLYWTAYHQHSKENITLNKWLSSIVLKLYLNAREEKNIINRFLQKEAIRLKKNVEELSLEEKNTVIDRFFTVKKMNFMEECFTIFKYFNNKPHDKTSYLEFLDESINIVSPVSKKAWNSICIPLIIHRIASDVNNFDNYLKIIEECSFDENTLKEFSETLQKEDTIKKIQKTIFHHANIENPSAFNDQESWFFKKISFLADTTTFPEFKEECLMYDEKTKKYTFKKEKLNNKWNSYIYLLLTSERKKFEESTSPIIKNLKAEILEILITYKAEVRNLLISIFNKEKEKK